jgi:hypothetical protein
MAAERSADIVFIGKWFDYRSRNGAGGSNYLANYRTLIVLSTSDEITSPHLPKVPPTRIRF